MSTTVAELKGERDHINAKHLGKNDSFGNAPDAAKAVNQAVL